MPDSKPLPVKKLMLDLANFRTVQQPDEARAVQAMIAARPDWFWALLESLIDDGYLPTESILVLRTAAPGSRLLVKEGNRRIAALKLIHGYLPCDEIEVPDNLSAKMATLPKAWRTANRCVPCTVYEHEEAAIVDRIVALAHGKGEKAGRDQWNAVARARHNRSSGASEPALELLEKYLSKGRNLNPEQADRWAGDYRISVLDEAMKKVVPCIGVGTAAGLASKYPRVAQRDKLEAIMHDIGLQTIGFKEIRADDFASGHGLVAPATAKKAKTPGAPAGPSQNTAAVTQGSTQTARTPAAALNDPRAVKRKLAQFQPVGNNRQKVVTLRDEARKLKIADTPLAFCFVLRSMFELSAKAYCDDHVKTGGPTYRTAKGQDKHLSDVLREITKHLSNQNKDKHVLSELHGAIAELAQPEGLLSVTSMNQLVHNPMFTITPGELSTLFMRVYPLLEAMNR
jgi:hypothetical protein